VGVTELQTGRPAARSTAAPVDVCICTFHRPAVVEALLSAAAQSPPPARIVVIDNAETPEASGRVAGAQTRTAVPLVYVHAPARNISVARNAALDAATADWIAFLDDDELAQPGWLAALLATARAESCDVVLGPVDAVYPADAPPWIRTLDAHSTRPVVDRGVIRKGYAGNAMLRRATVARLGLRFDPALGRSGGEDDRFFYDLTDAGGVIAYAPGALALEPALPARLSLNWLMRRSFRTGQTHGAHLRRRHGRAGRLAQAVLAAAKVCACAGGAAVNAASPPRRNRWLLRLSLHAGVVARLAGRRELELY
jgi:succinoglycan biosynthesis protein ExoM